MRPRTKKLLFSFSLLVFLFFYIPIMFVIIYSFNDSKLGTVWTGFTLDWYSSIFQNHQLINATMNSLYLAVISTVIATILGTLAALALYRYTFIGKKAVEFLFYIPVVIPDIVVAVALLAIYGILNVSLGLNTAIPGHVAITISYVMLVVLARLSSFDSSLEEAAKDLGANEWQTFWKVTFPLIFPGILAGGLLAFTISLDEFVISFFTLGPGDNTLPVLVYSMVRLGVSPEVNVLSTIIIVIMFIVVTIVGLNMRKKGDMRND
ncbi:ABC transporter permease [Ornithinibacillus massiliensis]|uniref:ABC transporter permease n=2 Tax=Ornithinibacillus TaxID=484508 RepID=A0A923RJG4_9BACI|nr:ABC transporter permease [Ornithinibacillus hominis]MBS3681695.1 ABC transporter permease [Ornithinibacillus massiliensis]